MAVEFRHGSLEVMNNMLQTFVQINLDPLGREERTPVIDEAPERFRHYSVEVQPGTMIPGDKESVCSALHEALGKASQLGKG